MSSLATQKLNDHLRGHAERMERRKRAANDNQPDTAADALAAAVADLADELAGL